LEQAAKLLKKPKSKINIISCHLGSGCSVTVIKNGQPIDTSMGFTPMEGLMMSTRGGDLDPGILIYLQEKLHYSLEKLKKMLNSEAGWLGVSGCKDFRDIILLNKYKVPGYKANKELLKRCKCAELALKMFRHRLLKYIGAYTILLPRLDMIILGGAIGSRSDIIFELLWQDLQHLRKLYPRLPVVQVQSDEALVIAKEIKTLKNA
jgi:acetate kinase